MLFVFDLFWSSGDFFLKSCAKLLPFFLIGGILLRNYYQCDKKILFCDAKKGKTMANDADFIVLG